MRDDFTEQVKRSIAARVNFCCSRPGCHAPTSGPQVDPAKALNVGVAAHIAAASLGDPRYNPALTSDERRHANNAIWLCQNCGKLVDNDEGQFTESEIRRWNRAAEAEAFARIGKAATAADPVNSNFSEEELLLLIACADRGELFMHSSDEAGPWIRAGRQHFHDPSDPAYAALYLDAFEALRRRELVRHEGGELYALTGRGFKIARALKQQQVVPL
jgi:hypothetical protein